MQCEFCSTELPGRDAENLELLLHVQQSADCGQQFNFLLENLRASWTRNMSGG